MRYPVVTIGLVLAAASVQAQSPLKPGLWEVRSNMYSASGEIEKAMAQMQQQMAAMSPEQRKMVHDMMARQGAGTAAGPGGRHLQVCMTKEMLERNEVALHEGDCKSTYAPRVGNTMTISLSCSNPPSRGEGQVEFIGPQAYQTRMTVTTTGAGGKAETIDMENHGKWLSAECGAVKPLAAKK